MNEHEIDRIAAAVNVLRPDWPVNSLRTLLGRAELTHRPRRDVAVALIWVACDSDTKTPARVIENGPWWRAATAGLAEEAHAPRPPKGTEACRLCGRHLDRCTCGQQQTRPPSKAANAAQYAEQARAAIRGAKEEGHG